MKRPQRIYHEFLKGKPRYFYLVKKKKKYIRIPGSALFSQKQIVNINLGNKIRIKRKKRTNVDKRILFQYPVSSKLLPIVINNSNKGENPYKFFEDRVNHIENSVNDLSQNRQLQLSNINPNISQPKPYSQLSIEDESFDDDFLKSLHKKFEDETVAKFMTNKKEKGESKVIEETPYGLKPKVLDQELKEVEDTPQSSAFNFLRRRPQNRSRKPRRGDIEEVMRPVVELSDIGIQTKYNPIYTIDNLNKPTLRTLHRYIKLNKEPHLPDIYSATGVEKTKDVILQSGYIQSLDPELFDELIQSFVKRTGSGIKSLPDGIDNFQLEKLLKERTHHVIPVISSDETDQILRFVQPHQKEPIGFVINDKTLNSPTHGKHWRSVFISPTDCSVEFYDSLLENKIPKYLVEGLHKIVKKIDPSLLWKFKHNLVEMQNPKSANCGLFASHFLIQRFKGKSFNEATLYKDYKKTKERQEKDGEKIISKEFKSYF